MDVEPTSIEEMLPSHVDSISPKRASARGGTSGMTDDLDEPNFAPHASGDMPYKEQHGFRNRDVRPLSITRL